MRPEEMVQEYTREDWEDYVIEMACPENVVRWAVSSEFPVPVSYPDLCEIMYYIILREENWDNLDHVPRDIRDAIYDRVYDMLTELGFTRHSREMLRVREERGGEGAWHRVRKREYLFTCPACGPEYGGVSVFCAIGGDKPLYLSLDNEGKIEPCKNFKTQQEYAGRENEMYIYSFHHFLCGARWSPGSVTREEFRRYYRFLNRPWPFRGRG